MRLAVVAPLVTPLRPAQLGGSQSFAADLAQALSERGHQTWLVCAQGSEVPGARLLEVPVPSEVGLALVRPGRAESVSASPALAEAFAAAYIQARSAGAEVVSQHGFDAEALEEPSGLPTLHTLHLPPLSKRMVDAVQASHQALATVSNACAAAWSRAGVRGLEVLPDGVPDSRPGSNPVEPLALVAGRISPEKGTAAAIEVARRVGLEPVVAGGVYDHAYYESEVRPLSARYLGELARADLWALMARAAVLLLAVEWEEPFGLVAAEAQTAGCPVAAYRRGGLVEVVEEGASGFLAAPGDPAGLAAAALRAAALDRAAVRASALRRLSLSAAAERYERRLQELV